MSRTDSRLRLLGLLFSLGWMTSALSGCLCTFERDWRAAQRQPLPSDNLAGLWEGTWESHSNGHNGKLRAIITRCANGHYHARYHATFAVIVPYAYDTVHTAVDQGLVTSFSGQQDLGHLAGGVYRYNGRADGITFVANYHADKDHGVFRMRRVGTAGCCADACDAWTPCAGLHPSPDATLCKVRVEGSTAP